MTDFEYSISQYLDGALPDEERAALEARVARDAQARALLEEYRRLDVAMKSVALPEVRWGALASAISAAVERTIDSRQKELAAPSYRLPTWVRFAAPLAMAASVLIAAGVGIRAYLSRPHQDIAKRSVHIAQSHSPVPQAVQVASVQVSGPAADRAEGPSVVQISIGLAKSAHGEPTVSSYNDAVVTRPSHVSVASGIAPSHDVQPLAFDMQ
jgi:anti-sigma factor RsiW